MSFSVDAQLRLASVLAGVLVGCAGPNVSYEPSIPTSEGVRLCIEGNTQPCYEASRLEAMLEAPGLELLEFGPTPAGNQGAKLLTLRSPDGVVFRAKWRADQNSTFLGNFSDPRRGLVSYAVQELLLEPHEFVIPPTVTRCFRVDEISRPSEELEATWPDTDCVFSYVSFWLPEVTTVADATETDEAPIEGESLYDEQRFESDELYAKNVARLNVMAKAISHGDAHTRQFLVQDDPFHVWSIDHSVSLTGIKNPFFFLWQDWSQVQVPSLPADLAERIMQLDRSTVDRRLALIAAYRVARGTLVRIPEGRIEPDLDADFAVRREGDLVLVGSTLAERQVVWDNLVDLREKLASGELGSTL